MLEQRIEWHVASFLNFNFFFERLENLKRGGSHLLICVAAACDKKDSPRTGQQVKGFAHSSLDIKVCQHANDPTATNLFRSWHRCLDCYDRRIRSNISSRLAEYPIPGRLLNREYEVDLMRSIFLLKQFVEPRRIQRIKALSLKVQILKE